ncbi:hypothetical protein ACUAXQ_004886 [Escherichia coli]
MKKIILVMLLLVMPITSFSKELGYGNTTWGMTPDEVLQTQNESQKLLPPEKYSNSKAKVKIDNVNIGSGMYTVNFLFDNSDHLIQTNITSNEANNIGIINLRFTELNKLLTQKYGKPEFQNNDLVNWKNASTSIELRKMVIPGISSKVMIRYTSLEKSENETKNL